MFKNFLALKKFFSALHKPGRKNQFIHTVKVFCSNYNSVQNNAKPMILLRCPPLKLFLSYSCFYFFRP